MKKPTGILLLLFLSTAFCYGQEICDNAIDDDGDSLIDLQDDECDCQDIFDDTVYLPNGDFESTLMCCPSNDFADGDCLESWIALTFSPELIDPDCYSILSEGEEVIGAPIDDNFLGMVYNDFNSFDLKETFGTCTNATLLNGNRYRLTLEVRMSVNEEKISGEGNPYLYFYGLKTCAELIQPSVIESDFCELDFDLTPLDSIPFDEILPGEWSKVTRDFIPAEDINAIIVAFDCQENFRYNVERFVLLDDINISGLLNQEFEYDLDIDGQGSLCDNDFMMTTSAVPDVSYQWYRDEVAIVGETGSDLSVDRDESLSGDYLLRITDVDGCYETEAVTVEIGSTTGDTTICVGQSLDIATGSFTSDGTYTEDVLTTFSCVNKTYNLTIDELIMGDTIRESYQEGTNFSFGGSQFDQEGDYDITLKTAEGCDSLVTLSLTEVDFEIRVPNVFTPNLTSDNMLTVYGKRGSAVEVRTFLIYDRWGNEIFSNQNFEPNIEAEGWNGIHSNGKPSQGIYSYYVEMEFVDGRVLSTSGDFLLLK